MREKKIYSQGWALSIGLLLLVLFAAAPAAATTWDFENNGTVNSTEQNPAHTYDVAGTYTVNLTVTNDGGSDTMTKGDYIAVNEATSPASDFTYTSDGSAITITGYTGQGGDVVIPGEIEGLPVTGIGDSAFYKNTAITSVTIPDSVTTIGYRAFRQCTALTSVTIPDSVTTIGNQAFQRCYALTSVTIPDSVTTIGSSMFRDCTSLASVTIPDGVTTIDNYAFMDCSALTSVTIPDSVTTIGDAFSGCTALTSMTFEGNAPTVGEFWAGGSDNLVVYYYEGATGFTTPTWNDVPCYPLVSSTPFADFSADVTSGDAPLTVQFTDASTGAEAWAWDFENDGTIDSTEQNPAHTYDAAGTYDVKLTVTNSAGSDDKVKTDYIAVSASGFTCTSDGSSITITGYTGPGGDVVIPGEIEGLPVTSIGAEAFLQNTALTSVTIPDSVTTIGPSAFFQNTALTSVTIGNGVTSIGSNAFKRCTALTSVTIGSGVTSIDNYAFYDCTALTSMTFEGNAPTVESNWAMDVPTTMVVYYTEGATGFTNPWNGFTTVMLGSTPTANFSADVTSGKAPLTVQFTDTSTGDITGWAWDFENDGTVDSTEQNPSHTYDAAGTYDVNLTVSNAASSDSETKTGYIAVLLKSPPVAFDQSVITMVDAPLGITLAASDSDEDPLTYEIVENPAHGTLSGTVPDVIYTPDAGYTGDDSFTFRTFDGTDYSNTATVSITVYTDGEHSPWAVEVVDYQGPFSNSIYYNDPNAVLGKPSTRCVNGDPGVPDDNFRIKLVEPAYATDLDGNNVITTLGSGSSYITVKFDHPVENDPNNPYGIDLLVFGNSFFVATFVSDSSNMDTYTLGSGIFAEPVTVAVSQDNVNWYTFTDGPFADGMFPTQAYHWDSVTHNWTDNEMDFTRPVDPSLTVDDFAGLTGAQAIALYDGSGGGTGYDIGALGLDWIQYVKVQSDYAGEIDAFADVAPQQLSAPVADFSADVTSGDAPLTTQFTDLSTNSPTSWAWDFDNDGTVDSTEQNPVHTYETEGTYTVNLTATNAAGSDDEVKTDYITVSVPEPECATLSFAPTPVDAGVNGTAEVSIAIDSLPAGLAGYNLTVTLDDPSVAEITAVDVPEWASLNATGTLSDGSVWVQAADLGESVSTNATNVTLATLTLTGLSSGTANITATVTRMDADDGSVIETNVVNGQVLVSTAAAVPGCENCPHDLNGDGICEDVNGNGLFDFDDVVTFFNAIEWMAGNEPTEAFDVNGNGRIDFADLVGLYQEI